MIVRFGIGIRRGSKKIGKDIRRDILWMRNTFRKYSFNQ